MIAEGAVVCFTSIADEETAMIPMNKAMANFIWLGLSEFILYPPPQKKRASIEALLF